MSSLTGFLSGNLRRDTEFPLYSVQMRENTDHKTDTPLQKEFSLDLCEISKFLKLFKKIIDEAADGFV